MTKSIHVTDCPLRITIEPWSETKRVIASESQPHSIRVSTASQYSSYEFDERDLSAYVKLRLADK